MAVDIDPGESVDVTLPDGKTAKGGDVFSFVHPSSLSISKSDLGDHVTQYLMASAVGTIVVLQEYGGMNPVSLDQLMLQEMSKEAVQAGAKLTQERRRANLPTAGN